MVFESLLNPVFGPLLSLNPLVSILILALGITLIITLAYKYLTDQEEMKKLKTKMKDYQKKIRELQKKDPTKAMEMQKKAMELNMKYMKHSFKPTIYTFLPIIIIFGWMNAHLTYLPIAPDQDFTITATMIEDLPGSVSLISIPEIEIDEVSKPADEEVSWKARAELEGEYDLIIRYGEKEFHKKLLISDRNYVDSLETFDGSVKSIDLGMKKIKPLGDISLLGWRPGWLGTYILFSLVFSIGLRKVLNIS